MKKNNNRYLAILGSLVLLTFSITGCNNTATTNPSALAIIAPAANEVITVNTQNYQIKWSGANIASQKTLEYSLDNGVTWVQIAAFNANVTSYGWNVPNTASSNAIIRLTDKNGLTTESGIFTISAAIKPPAMSIVTPAANEVIPGGTSGYQITWTGNGIATLKTLDYSLDNGGTWSSIGVLNADLSAYGWDVPNTASTTAKVRITDKNGLVATSGDFTITPSAALILGEMDATLSGAPFKALNGKAINSLLTATVKASLKKQNNVNLDSVSLTLVVAKQGIVPYTLDLSIDDFSQITYCIVNPSSGTCSSSFTAKKGAGSGTMTITSITPTIEGIFSGTLPSVGGTGSITITNGAFKAQLN